MSLNITVVMVNFKTPKLVERAASDLVRIYPEIPLILMDNGGCRQSLAAIRDVAKGHPNVHVVRNGQNIGHGPAMHRGFELVDTPYVFTLDSDTRITQAGFLELMLEAFAKDPKLFAIGWLRYVNDNGVASPHQELKRGHPYVHPYAALYRRKFYSRLAPFVHTGAPSINLMKSAIAQGYHLAAFPVEEYVWHKVAGTRGRFRGQCRVPTNARPGKWRYHRI